MKHSAGQQTHYMQLSGDYDHHHPCHLTVLAITTVIILCIVRVECCLNTNLRVPLKAQATKSPGSPGIVENISMTKYGIS